MLLFLLFMVSACSSNASADESATASASSMPESSTSRSASVPKSATATQTKTYPIKVYFSRLPQSNNDPDAVFPVDRLSPTSSVGTLSIQQLIAGPTMAESTLGYFSEVKNHLVGPSTCPSATTKPDFILSLNTDGSTHKQGTATLKFCHQFVSAGVVTDARAIAEIDATLKQFSSIKKIVILTKDSHCFGDESGADVCLRQANLSTMMQA